MTNNKIDPVHAVTSMALALVEIQKDLAQLTREHAILSSNVVGIDKALVSKFAEVDKRFNFLFGKEIANAANIERKESNGLDGKNVQKQEEGKVGLLRDGERGEAEGSGGEEQESFEETE